MDKFSIVSLCLESRALCKNPEIFEWFLESKIELIDLIPMFPLI